MNTTLSILNLQSKMASLSFKTIFLEIKFTTFHISTKTIPNKNSIFFQTQLSVLVPNADVFCFNHDNY